MHYKAKKSITPNGWEVIGYIPTFLLMKTDKVDTPELLKFLRIMELEIIKGNSFDMKFFEYCIGLLKDWINPASGDSPEIRELLIPWIKRIESLEEQNIINTHNNKYARCTLSGIRIQKHTVL